MTKRERVLATIERRPVDRPSAWLGHPTAEALPALYGYLSPSHEALLPDVPPANIAALFSRETAAG